MICSNQIMIWSRNYTFLLLIAIIYYIVVKAYITGMMRSTFIDHFCLLKYFIVHKILNGVHPAAIAYIRWSTI